MILLNLVVVYRAILLGVVGVRTLSLLQDRFLTGAHDNERWLHN